MIINKIQEFCIHLFLIDNFVNYLIFHPKIVCFQTFNSEFSYIEVWLTDQNFKPLEIEDKTNIILVIN